jgi:hypothetical protein
MLALIKNIAAAGTPDERAFGKRRFGTFPSPNPHFPREEKQCRNRALVGRKCARVARFSTLYPQTYPQSVMRGDVHWHTVQILEQNRELGRILPTGNSKKKRTTFFLVGQERVNIGMENPAICN